MIFSRSKEAALAALGEMQNQTRIAMMQEFKPVDFTGWVILAFAVLQLVLCFISYKLDKHEGVVYVSESILAVAFGLLLGTTILAVSNEDVHEAGLHPDFLFYALLPPIILEAGFNTKKRGFFSNISTTLLLAVVGTLISTFVMGFALVKAGEAGIITQMSAAECLMFGSLISATDPVATLSVFRKAGVPAMLYNLVFGESMLNDGVAIVAFQLFSSYVAKGEEFHMRSVSLVIAQASGIMIGSLCLAAVVCFASAYFLKKLQHELYEYPAYELSIIILSAYLSYILADLSHLSGIVALFFSGVMMSHYHLYNISPPAAIALTHMLSMIGFLCENVIFMYLGLSLVAYFDEFVWDFWFIGVAAIAVLASRLANIYPLCLIANICRERPIPLSYMSVMWFAGLRGAIAFALALRVETPRHPEHGDIIKSTTLVIVLGTTVFMGIGTMPLLQCLGVGQAERTYTEDLETPLSLSEALMQHEPFSSPTDFGERAGTENHEEEKRSRPSLSSNGVYGQAEEHEPLVVDPDPLLLAPEHATAHHHYGWLHRWWVDVDEKFVKPLLGGKARSRRDSQYYQAASNAVRMTTRDVNAGIMMSTLPPPRTSQNATNEGGKVGKRKDTHV